MILDIPELLLKAAQYSDWRAVLALQRLNRGAYRDRPVLVQEELWRCAVNSRWPWVWTDYGHGRAWITACGSWRRVYAYLRAVSLVACPSEYDYNTEYNPGKPPSLRVSRTPAYNPRYGLGARNPPLSRVEECAWSEEPLAESEGIERFLGLWTGIAYMRPGLLTGPIIWVAKFTVYAPDAEGLLLGVRTGAEHSWHFDIGDYMRDDSWVDDPYPRVRAISPNLHFVFDGDPIDCNVFKAPMRLSLVVDLTDGTLHLDVLHDHTTRQGIWPVRIASIHCPHLAPTAANRHLELFVAFGTLYNQEENATYELPSDVDEWDPWSDHYPERLRRRGYASLDEFYPLLKT